MPAIVSATTRLTSFNTAGDQGEAYRSGMKVRWYEGWDGESINVWLPVIGRSTPMINSTSEISVDQDGKPRESSADSPGTDIEMFGAAAYSDPLVSEESMETFAL